MCHTECHQTPVTRGNARDQFLKYSSDADKLSIIFFNRQVEDSLLQQPSLVRIKFLSNRRESSAESLLYFMPLTKSSRLTYLSATPLSQFVKNVLYFTNRLLVW